MYSISAIWKIRPARIFLPLIGAIAIMLAPPCPSARPAGAASARNSAAGGRKRPLPPPKPIALPADLDIPDYQPGPNPFRSGETLVYEAAWMNVPAGAARITIARNSAHPDLWSGMMWLNTSPIVDVVYRMRDFFREDFAAGTLRPENIQITQHENHRLDHWRVAFDHAAHTITATKVNRRGRVTVRRFTGGDPLGPFSGAIMALSQPLKPGSDLKFDIFSGGNRYVFGFDVVGRERITTALGTFDTVKIEPSVIWLSEGSFRADARETTIWITDDSRHLPVRIAAAVFFGNVYADLVSVTGAPFGSLGVSAAAGGPSPRATTNPYAGMPAPPSGAPTP